MTHYLISSDPSTTPLTDRAIRNAASRRGVMVHYDPVLGVWMLIEPRLQLPIGSPLRSLAALALVVYGIPLPKWRKTNGRHKPAKSNGRPHPVSKPLPVVIDLNQEADHHG